MSDPRWRDAEPSNPPSTRRRRPPGATDRYPGMPDSRPPDLQEQTRRMQQVPPELRARRGPGGPPDRGAMPGRDPRRQRGGLGFAGGFGDFSGLAGIGIVAASALLGAIITVVLRRDPGTLLGVCVIAGTLVAGLAVRPRSARLIIPVPTLSYVVAATVAGAINDRSADTSHLADLVHAGTWIASGFLSMTMATIMAVVITGLRLYLDWRTRPQRPKGAGSGPSSRRPDPRGPGQRRPEQGRDGTGPYRPEPGMNGQGQNGQGGPARPPYGPAAPLRPSDSGSYPSQAPYGSGPYPPQAPSGPYPAKGPTGPYPAKGPSGPYPSQGPSGPGPAGGGPSGSRPSLPPGPSGNGRSGTGPSGNGRSGGGPSGSGSSGRGRYGAGPYQLPPGQGDRHNFSSGA
jgi:uncharacterized membrane protein YgcG